MIVQSALYLADVLEKERGANITDLNLSRNNLLDKAGMYIGDALVKSQDYPLQQLLFKGVDLQKEGTRRVFDSIMINKKVKRLHIGLVGNSTLQELTQMMERQPGLIELEFQEDQKDPWELAQTKAFAKAVRNHTQLESVRFTYAELPEEDLRLELYRGFK